MLTLPIDQLIAALLAILVGLTVHELAHAWTALLLGDDTAKRDGRVTWNPLKHIDPIGFVLLLVAGFGWAKPVMIDRQKLKNPRRDDTLIALAGPLSNFLLALGSLVALRVITSLLPRGLSQDLASLFDLFGTFAGLNVALFVFNLFPIPPLDGSHVLLNLLPRSMGALGVRFFRYGAYFFLLIILLEQVTSLDIIPIGWLVRTVLNGMLALVWAI